MVFREGRTKAVGNVLKLLPTTHNVLQNRAKPNKMQARSTQKTQQKENEALPQVIYFNYYKYFLP